MCRILLARFKQPTKPQGLLTSFAAMAKRSKSLDGDWQGDGWGVAWLDAQQNWQTHTALAPVWEESPIFERLPETLTLVAHARSASFPQHKGILAFNQPYTFGPYAFVFNGLIKGVSLPPTQGQIGAQKIWHLLKTELLQNEPQAALEKLATFIQNHCKEIVALNIGLATPHGIYALNEFSRHPEYYTLHRWETDDTEIICSEPLGPLLANNPTLHEMS